jgi:hypothetical protein
MRTIVAGFIAVIFIAVQAFSQETPAQHGWRSYGKGVHLDKITPLKTLLAKGKPKSQKEVVVSGVVTEVCQRRGCWMVVEDGGSHVRVEFEDYGFFVPWDSKGKRVKLQGYLKDKTISAAAAMHMAEEMEKPPFERDKVQDKQTITIFLATGVSMEGGSEISEEQLEVIHGDHEHHDHE